MIKISIILYDGGYKEYAPALMSLANQTIINNCEVYWIEYKDKVFPEVYKYNFIKPVSLNLKSNFNVSILYNAGGYLANKDSFLFLILDPCLWCYKTFLEDLYNFHKDNVCISHNRELRGWKIDPRPKQYDHKFYKNWIEQHERTFSKEDHECVDVKEKWRDKFYKKWIKKFRRLVTDENLGCATAIETRLMKELGGFDALPEHEGTISNSIRLFNIRAKNKYGIENKLISKTLYHAWHPVDYSNSNTEKMASIEKEYIDKKIIEVAGGFEKVEDSL